MSGNKKQVLRTLSGQNGRVEISSSGMIVLKEKLKRLKVEITIGIKRCLVM